MENLTGITFERTSDWDLVKKIATHPKIWPTISDDFSPPRDKWQPVETSEIWYVLVRGKGVPIGFFMFAPETAVCWHSHICILPIAWGDVAHLACRLVFYWLWERTECRRIIGSIPVSNPLAIKFAVQCGMERYGVNPKSFMRRGQLEDQILVGINRPEDFHVEGAA